MPIVRKIVFVAIQTTGAEAMKNDNAGSERLFPWHEISKLDILVTDRGHDIISRLILNIKVENPHRADAPENFSNYDGIAIAEALQIFETLTRDAIVAVWDIGAVGRFLEAAQTVYKRAQFDARCFDGYLDVRSWVSGLLNAKGHVLPVNLNDVLKLLAINHIESSLSVREAFMAAQQLPMATPDVKADLKSLGGCQMDDPPATC